MTAADSVKAQMGIEIPEDFPVVPPNGWQLEDFPRITVAPIAYATNPALRADPGMSISPEGWLYIDVGAIRFALPSRDEWGKLVLMAEKMWNSHELALQQRDLDKLEDSVSPTG